MRYAATLILCALVGSPAIPVAQETGQNQFTPPRAKEGFRYPDCFCTDSAGERVELGKVACLQIGSKQVLAKCSMSLNNPTWRRMSEGCPTT